MVTFSQNLLLAPSGTSMEIHWLSMNMRLMHGSSLDETDYGNGGLGVGMLRGGGGFPYLKVNKFVCFLVSVFLLLLFVFWAFGFLASWIQITKGSKIPNPSIFFEDIGSIWPNCHFMLPGWHWSHIHDSQEFIRRMVGIFSAHLFQQQHS